MFFPHFALQISIPSFWRVFFWNLEGLGRSSTIESSRYFGAYDGAGEQIDLLSTGPR